MLAPKRSKYRKAHKGRIHGLAKGGTTLNFGAYGLKAMDPGRITARQIEAARRAITRHIKRAGRVWIRIFPDVPVSQKPQEVRMGSGKGSPEFWVCRVKPGRIMFEIDGVAPELAREARTLGAAKLPIKTKMVTRIGDACQGPRDQAWRQGSGCPRQDRRRTGYDAARPAQGAVQPALPARNRAARRRVARA